MSQRSSLAPIHPNGAYSVCFNNPSEMPTPFTKDLLVDTGVWVALFDGADDWAAAVGDFWDTYVLQQTHAPCFYITPDIINEYLHRIYTNHRDRMHRDPSGRKRQEYAQPMLEMLQNGVVTFINLDAKSALQAINRWSGSSYGAKDAFHITCQLDYGLDLITVDHALMMELENDTTFHGRTVYYPDLSMFKT